jgi:hypothetical protein
MAFKQETLTSDIVYSPSHLPIFHFSLSAMFTLLNISQKSSEANLTGELAICAFWHPSLRAFLSATPM